MAKIYTDYFLDEEDFDKNHFRYKKLSIPDGVEAKPLAVPPVLKPDKVSGNEDPRGRSGQCRGDPG